MPGRKDNMAIKVIGLLVLYLIAALPAHAYVGPGLGVGVVGVILGIIGSIFLALFAIFWYPIKKAIKKIKNGKKGVSDTTMNENDG